MVRRPSRSFVDPRFVGGVFLIVLSVVLAVVVLRSATAGVAVYQARSDLAAGERVSAGDFVVVDARVPEGVYVASGSLPPKGELTRSVGRGELLPVSAIGAAGDRHPLVLTLAQPLASSVRVGDRITLWAAPGRDGAGGPQEGPRVLSREAIYVAKAATTTVSVGGPQIEVRVPEVDLPAVVAAVGEQTPIVAVAGQR